MSRTQLCVCVCVVTESALFSLVERTGKRTTTTFGGSKTVLTQLRTPESAAWWNTPNFGCFYDYIGTRDLAGITESGPFTPRCPQPWPPFRKIQPARRGSLGTRQGIQMMAMRRPNLSDSGDV